MVFNVTKFLGKNLVLVGLILVFGVLGNTAWARKIAIFDSSLHYCVKEDTEDTKEGPFYTKKGGVGPCHDFSSERFGALFRFKLYFVDDLSGSSFQGVEVKKLKLTKKRMEGINFRKSKIELFLADYTVISFSDFSEAVLTNAKFHEVMALSARFVGTNLHGSDLSLGHFNNAFFTKAILTSANLTAVECRQCVFNEIRAQQLQAKNAHFEGADFSGAELKFGKFNNSIFEDANLQGTDFSSAELDGAKLKGADLTGAIFHTASLQGADLSEVKGVEIKWRFAKFDSATKLPFSHDEAIEKFGMVFVP